MTDRYRFVALTASATALTSLLVAGCGSYENGPKAGAGTGGTMMPSAGTGGTTGGSGGAATGGTAGTMGGSNGAGVGGTGGSAGAAGSGGSAQAGGGAGGAPTGGASGSGGADAGSGGAAGGGGAAVACEEAAACGGDVVGTWSAAGCEMTVSGMADLTGAGIGCAAAPVEGSLKVTGTLTITADGMFMDNTLLAGELVLDLAPACLMISGTMGAGCDRLDLVSSGLHNIVCVGSSEEGCVCTVPVEQSGGLGAISVGASLNESGSGTYTAADNKLVLTASGKATEYPYCVAGSTMTVARGTPNTLGMVAGPIVLQKQ
jgi:hypothetical protein